jgi:hypothetical protein
MDSTRVSGAQDKHGEQTNLENPDLLNTTWYNLQDAR